MRTRRNILLLLAGVTVLIVVLSGLLYFSAARLINSETVKEKIHGYLLGKAGADITYGNSELHLFPLPEIVFHQVTLSLPGKAEGTVGSLRVYPDLVSLMRGTVSLAKLSLDAPHVIITISEDTEKTSLEEIEEKVRSVVRYLVSATPGLRMVIRDGKLDFTEDNRVAFSFDLIQSRFSAARKSLDIELTGRSNIADQVSISSSLAADDLKSKGIIRFTHLRPDILIARLSQKAAERIGVSGLNLSAKFETTGLRVVHASIESSLSGLAVSRETKRVTMGDAIIKGEVAIDPDAVSVSIREAKISSPALNVSGQYTRDRRSGFMTADLEGKSIALQPVRESALDFGGDIPLVRTIFAIVQGGDVPVLHVHSSGKSLTELGQTENIRLTGKMRNGNIRIEAKDLTFRDVSGTVVISRGILEADDVRASLEDHRCSAGRLRIGLKGTDAPFHLDMQVKAIVEHLPAFLKDKHLLKNEAVLHEMDRLHDLRGSAGGRLILGDRLDSVHVKIAVDSMNIMARYEPLPFPIAVTGGKLFFDEKTLALTDSGGSIGGSTFSGLTARLGLADPFDLEITGGQLSVSADEIYPWLTSFEKIRPVLRDLRSVNGLLSVSSVGFRGPLYQPKKWKYHISGETKKLAIDAAFLPGRAEEMSGMFTITENELSLKNMRSRVSDSLVTVTGSVRDFPSDIKSIDLSLQGEIGPEVTTWTSTLLKLPSEMKIRAPFSVTDAVLSFEKERKTAFSGRLLFGQGTQVSLSVAKTPDAMTIRDLAVKTRDTDLAAGIVLAGDTVDASFKGRLTSQALDTIFADSIFSDASLEGDFRTHVVMKQLRQSTAEGRLKGQNIPVPWDRDIPLTVRHVTLEAKDQGIVVDRAELTAGDMTFTAKGTVSSLPSWFDVDMDISANGIEWEAFEKMLRNKGQAADRGQAAKKEQAGFMKDMPVRGTVRLRSELFRYRQLRWEPLYADVSFDGTTVRIAAKEAALCGVSTTGTVGITEQGLKLDIALSAKDLPFRPTILCLTDKHSDYTGTFQLEARLKGEGEIGEIMNRLDGTFALTAKDGKILKSRQLDKTFDLLNESENFKGQFPDLDREFVSYSALKIRGSVRGNRVQIEEGMLDSSAIGIVARGHLDLSTETLDLNAFVSPLRTVQRVVKGIPVLGHVMGENLVSIPVKISGDMKDPQLTFLSPSAIGAETLGIVERTLTLPVTLIQPVFPAQQNK